MTHLDSETVPLPSFLQWQRAHSRITKRSGASVDAEGSAVAQEYPLLVPHSRPYQSQSVSPNGDAPKV